MADVFSILNCMDHRSLSWHTPHKAEYGFTPNVTHIMDFEFLETILILDDKTQFHGSREILGYYARPDPNIGAINCSWVWTEEHVLLSHYVLHHANRPTDPNHQMVWGIIL